MPESQRLDGAARNQVLYSGLVVIVYSIIACFRFIGGDAVFAAMVSVFGAAALVFAVLAHKRIWLDKNGSALSVIVLGSIMSAVYLRGQQQLVWVFPAMFAPALIAPARVAHILLGVTFVSLLPALLSYFNFVDGLRFFGALLLTLACVLLFMRSRERETDHLKLLAGRDPLTNLGNRRSLESAFNKISNKRERAYSIAVIDLDRFKSVNDEYGHLVGDQLLQEFSQFLVTTLPKNSQCFRYGGEEFVAIFPSGVNEAKTSVQQLLDHTLETSFAGQLSISFSAGVAEYKEGSLEGWLSRADHALLAAKREGRCRVYMGS